MFVTGVQTCALPIWGEIHAIVSNVGNEARTLPKDSRIGQLIIMPVVIADFVNDLGGKRGAGAFGSTGK